MTAGKLTYVSNTETAALHIRVDTLEEQTRFLESRAKAAFHKETGIPGLWDSQDSINEATTSTINRQSERFDEQFENLGRRVEKMEDRLAAVETIVDAGAKHLADLQKLAENTNAKVDAVMSKLDVLIARA